MVFIDGKGWKLSVSEGWVQVSNGALQYEKKTSKGKLGITHSAAPPTISSADSFIETNLGIRMSLGSTPCYVHAIGEDIYLAYEDIS